MKPSVQSVDVQWGKCLTNFKAYYDITYMCLYMQVNVGNAVHNINTQGWKLCSCHNTEYGNPYSAYIIVDL